MSVSTGQQFSKLSFEEAAEKNLAERIARLAPRSIQTERERMRPLCTVFGSLKVNRITVEMVRSYMTGRTGANVANKTINLELGVLRSVLKRAKLWHLLMDEIKPLPVHSQIGRTGVKVTFPNLNAPPFGGEDFQTNLIMPEPTFFVQKSFGPVSIIRPTHTKGAAMGALKALTADGLFIGQSNAFFQYMTTLAAEADAAVREC